MDACELCCCVVVDGSDFRSREVDARTGRDFRQSVPLCNDNQLHGQALVRLLTIHFKVTDTDLDI